MTTRTVPDYIPEAWLDDVRLGRVDLDNAFPVVDARTFAAAVAYDWRLDETTRDDLVLVVDELVSNVERHAARPAGWHAVPVRVERHAHRIVVEVADQDPTMPVWSAAEAFGMDDVDRYPEDAPVLIGGRGGAILAGLCEGLGARREEGGKVVRAVLALPDPRAYSGPTEEELAAMYADHFGVRLLDAVVEAVR